MALTSGLIANSDLLASNNLLPRRVGLHLAGLLALLLANRRRALFAWVPVSLLGWSLLAWARSDARYAGATALFDEAAALCLMVALAQADVPRLRLMALLVAVITGGALLGLIDQWWALPLASATRPAGLFASRATAGALFSAAIPLTALRLRRRPGLASVAIVLQTACLVSTRARAAWAAAIIVTAMVAVIAPALRRRFLLATFTGALAAIVLTPGAALNWRSPEPYQQSLLSLARVQVGDRTTIWRETMQLIAARPLGWGPGSFETEFGTQGTSASAVSVESPHNEVLRVAFELGLPGVLLMAAFVLRARGQASTRTWLLRLSLLALMICGMTGKTFEEPPTLLLGCCLMGLLLRHRSRRKATAAERLMLLGAAACILGAMVSLDAPQLAASQRLAEARRSTHAGKPREAWEQVGGTLSDNRELEAWLWAATLFEEAGDASRCKSVTDDALTRYRRNRFLIAQQERCSRH